MNGNLRLTLSWYLKVKSAEMPDTSRDACMNLLRNNFTCLPNNTSIDTLELDNDRHENDISLI